MSIRDELVDAVWNVETRDLGGVTKRDAEEIADAILARYAVVERPDLLIPTEDGSAPGMKLWYLAGITVSAGRGEVWTRQSFRNRGPGGARTLASVLIEAADHAEATDVDR
ncbi:hypothetical protein NWP13_23810 [Rhodococcus pyridinivorans]|nr:hypothetical protein [Rhodococcus pyridinivorans]